MLAPVPLAWLVLVRTLTHWATTALPLIVFAPLLAELLHLPHAQLPVLLASLLLGTPLLSLIGAVVAALTVGMRRSGILVALLADRKSTRLNSSHYFAARIPSSD